MSNNVLVQTLKYIAVEILWDIVYFPIWWYTKGFVRIYRYCSESANFHLHRRVALGIWLRSMFKPMYGDYTKEGRIISFFMRCVVLVWKLLSTVLWFLVLFLLICAWVILPLVIIYYILYQLFGVPWPFVK
ncbi:MAG: hypothetical protein PHY34_05795 [Patescibacteria group bacterium]|nr:hypothetical protein [Patescibacteria group bacterium]MDD5716153.1 hypothetical protein [Patescibacteria group bacterium]